MDPHGEIHEFAPSGVTARVAVISEKVSVEALSFNVVSTTYGEVEGIGNPSDGPYLVSAMVLDRLGPEYAGVAFAPDTGPSAVRNNKGHIDYVVQLKTVSSQL